MPNLREEITKTFTHLIRRGDSRSNIPAADPREGRQFGNYRIIRRLGAGGMGQVYLALDTRLGRHVAMKFLSPDLVPDPVSLLRLVQEARAASALNHPNILTIFDFGEVDGEHFIVSEFVEGVTLRTALERNALNGHSPVDVAIQIASALSAAHAAGVIHRDLKPTNVMLRPDGYLKVIDFGLAKVLNAAKDGTSTPDLTRPGSTMGTADYMSPEQARGEPVDHRADIWSLGVMLYEMVAGRRPFEGPTLSHVLVAIQDHAVPVLPGRSAIDSDVQPIILRALAKRPKDRYGSSVEMLHDLQRVGGGSGSSASRIVVGPARRPLTFSRTLLLWAAAILLVAAGLLIWWRLRQPKWLHVEPMRQLTFNGRVQRNAISPDGKYVAYTVGEPDGQQALYLNQIDSPADELKIPPRKINYRGLTFSPDNQALYVVEKDEALMGRLFAVPLLGKRANSPIVMDVDGPISFSPKGDQFVYVRHQQVKGGGNSTLSSLIVASRDGRNIRPLISTTDVYLFRQPVWSPDGKRIAVFLLRSRQQGTGESLLDLIGLDGSESRRLLADWQTIGQPQWSPDGKSLVVSVGTYSQPNKRFQLHQLSIVNGADRLLTNDLGAFSEASLSSDGKEMTAVKTDAKAVIWISQPNDFTHGSTLPAEAEKDPSLAWSDAAHLIVDSRRNGFPNIGLLDAETQSFIPLTNEQFMEQGAALVPGNSGKSIVFASNRSGEFHIWRFDEETNKLQQLTFGPNYDERPSLSSDGQWVVYASWADNVPRLMKVRSSGGASTQVGDYSAEDPQVSPDGKWIACYLQDPASKKWSVAIVPFEGDSQPRMVPLASVPVRWSPDGSAITASRTSATGVSNIWRIPLNGDAPKELTDFEDRAILAFAWSPSGDRLACLRGTVGADVALFKTGN